MDNCHFSTLWKFAVSVNGRIDDNRYEKSDKLFPLRNTLPVCKDVKSYWLKFLFTIKRVLRWRGKSILPYSRKHTHMHTLPWVWLVIELWHIDFSEVRQRGVPSSLHAYPRASESERRMESETLWWPRKQSLHQHLLMATEHRLLFQTGRLFMQSRAISAHWLKAIHVDGVAPAKTNLEKKKKNNFESLQWKQAAAFHLCIYKPITLIFARPIWWGIF